MDSPAEAIRRVALDLMREKHYAVFHLADGNEVVFIPCSVSEKQTEAGERLWLSVGLAFDIDTREEEYACVFLDRVVFITHLPSQPIVKSDA